jgi:hypothetical protein
VEQCRAILAATIAKGTTKESGATSEHHAHITLAITDVGQSKFVKPRLPVGSVVMGGVRVILGKQIMWWLVIPHRCCCRPTDPATQNDLINAKIKNNYY